jgi:hypothetical protein
MLRKIEAEGEVGRPPGRERRLDLVRKLVGIQNKLDLLAAVLLERCDDLPDRLLLLWVIALIPPDDEVGGLRAERRHDEHRGENRTSAAHVIASPIGLREYLPALGAWQRSRQPDLSRSVGFREGRLGGQDRLVPMSGNGGCGPGTIRQISTTSPGAGSGQHRHRHGRTCPARLQSCRRRCGGSARHSVRDQDACLSRNPPIAMAFVERLPRRALLVGLDLVRAAVVLALPFVTQVWQVYVLIFRFQAGVRGVYPDLPGDYSRSIARGERLHEGTRPRAVGLRPRKRRQPTAGGSFAHGHQLPRGLHHRRDRPPSLGGSV